jgi:hypothetical protein
VNGYYIRGKKTQQLEKHLYLESVKYLIKTDGKITEERMEEVCGQRKLVLFQPRAHL